MAKSGRPRTNQGSTKQSVMAQQTIARLTAGRRSELMSRWNSLPTAWMPHASQGDLAKCIEIVVAFRRSIKDPAERSWYQPKVAALIAHFHEESGHASAAIVLYKRAAALEIEGWVKANSYTRLACLVRADQPLSALHYLDLALACCSPRDSVLSSVVHSLLDLDEMVPIDAVLTKHRGLIKAAGRTKLLGGAKSIIFACLKLDGARKSVGGRQRR